MFSVPVFLVSCVAVLANCVPEVGFADGGLFEAKERCLRRAVSRIAPSCCGRIGDGHRMFSRLVYGLIGPV